MTVRRIPLVLALLALVAAAHADAPKAVTFDSEKLARIGPAMNAFVREHKAAGIVTLVATGDRIVWENAIGLADIEAQRPMTKDTLFWIASMTKPITGAALMILQDEGKVSLDDPVSKYIPAFKDTKLDGKAPAREITLRDLATHTSGIGEATGSQSVAGSTIKDVAEKIAAQPLRYEPGSKWNYGSGLTVIGRVIEIAGGQPYEQFLQQRIFDPLGMKDTTFNLSSDQLKRIARSYQPSKEGRSLAVLENRYVIDDPAKKQTPNPSGGLFTTAADLSRFYQMVLRGGEFDGKRILSERAVKQMTSLAHDEKIITGFTPGNGWGIGWCVVRQPQGVSAMLSPGSAGHGGAHGTQSWLDPKRGIIYIMLVQRTGFGNGDASDIRTQFQKLAAEAAQ